MSLNSKGALKELDPLNMGGLFSVTECLAVWKRTAFPINLQKVIDVFA